MTGRLPVTREQVEEVLLLRRRQLDQRERLLVRVGGEQVAAHQRQPVAEELVLGAAQADALGAVLQRERGVATVVGVRADAEAAQPVGAP